MKQWPRRLLGALAIIGGGIGVIATFTLVVSRINVIDWLFCAFFMALYIWGICCGVRLIEGQDGALKANLRFWLCQVPALTSPLAGYFFGAGFYVTVWVSPSTLERGFSYAFGSTFRYSLLELHQPFVVGINLVAVAASVWLYREMREEARRRKAYLEND